MALRLSLAEDAARAGVPVAQPAAWYPPAKRALDVVVSVVALIVLSPIFLLIALLIMLDSPGPAIFAQTRIGRDGRPFLLYKFRTMLDHAERHLTEMPEYLSRAEPIFKLKDDPRITRAGRALRRLSLDELPQLLNVLKGDMSVVGPRPPLPGEVAEYAPRHMRRLEVIPGMTGLWQISGRSDLPFEQWVDLDLEYIDHRSLWLDLRIMLRTIPVVLSGEGAY